MFDLTGVSKVYRQGSVAINAVDGVDLHLDDGEFVAIVGASGAGKSTLLQLLGALDRPTSGSLSYDGADLAKLADRKLAALRRHHFGFVFQNFNLIPTLTASENVEAALFGAGRGRQTSRSRAAEVLEIVGLAHRAGHLPDRLSGGEQQRVAVARALANEPAVIFADEPTGNLDHQTGGQLVQTLALLHEQRGLTVVMVTHDLELTTRAGRIITMRDGRIATDVDHTARTSATAG